MQVGLREPFQFKYVETGGEKSSKGVSLTAEQLVMSSTWILLSVYFLTRKDFFFFLLKGEV